MTTSSIPNLSSALERARLPASVVVENRYFDPPKLLRHVDSRLDGAGALSLLEYVLQANAMRDHMQKQISRAVAVLASPDHLNWARLASNTRGAVPRKPRIGLWAEFNGRNTLEILACPRLDPGEANGYLTREVVATRSDYVELRATWPYYGARDVVVFRALADEYVDRTDEEETRLSRRDGQGLLRDALVDSLSYLVTTLESVCDVRIGSWPKYTDSGRLDLLSPADRARADVGAQLPGLKQRRLNLEALIAEKVSKHNLASVAEFEELAAQAAREGVKITSLIFAKTGQRCSSIGTGKISALLVECREVTQQLAELEQGLLALRVL